MSYSYATTAQTETWGNTVLSQVYAWMTAGLAVTGAVAAVTAHSPIMQAFIFGNIAVYWGLLIAELILAFALSATVSRLPTGAAMALFLLYTALNGLTLSGIFLYYTGT